MGRPTDMEIDKIGAEDVASLARRLGCDRGFGPAGRWRGYHHVIDHHATHNPDAPAIQDACGTWSYAELAAASRQAAAFLSAAGLGAGGAAAPRWEEKPLAPRPLAIWVTRCREFVALCIGAWRLGLPIVALSHDLSDKEAEQGRSQQVARDLRPFALLGDERAQELWGGQHDGVARLFWADALEAIRGSTGPQDELNAEVSPEWVLAYVYTGGTTKASKCVAVTHSMALWEAENYSTVLGRGAGVGDKMLQPSSLYWGAAVFGQLSLGFSVGACVCVGGCPGGCGGAGDALRQMAVDVESFGITVLGVVPSQLRGAWPDGPATAPGCLRMLVMWADKCPVELSRRWQTSRLRVVDLLIASEYWLALHSDCKVWSDGNVEKHIYRKLESLDARFFVQVGDAPEQLRDALPGEVGEMYLSGPTTSPGYVCPDGRVTLEFHDALKSIDGKAYLRTRDQLLVLPDGGLVYSGRADSMMKHGGQWVDADALQDAVMAVPGVAQAAVLPSAAGIDAFVVLCRAPGDDATASIGGEATDGLEAAACHGEQQNGETQGEEGPPPSKRARVDEGEGRQAPFRVLAAARRALPSSTPGGCRVHLLTSIPLNPATAKVDRKALVSYLAGMSEEKQRYSEVQDGLERRLMRYYGAWGFVALGAACGPQVLASVAADVYSLATAAAGRQPQGAVPSALAAVGIGAGSSCLACLGRLLVLPQLWVAATYLEERHKEARWAKAVGDALRRLHLPASWARWVPLVAAALLPSTWLSTGLGVALTFIAWERERDAALTVGLWSGAAAVALRQTSGVLPGLALASLSAAAVLPKSRRALVELVRCVASAPGLCWQVLPKYLADDFGFLVEGRVHSLEGHEPEDDSSGGLLAALRSMAQDLKAPQWNRSFEFVREAAVPDMSDQVRLEGDRGADFWNSIGVTVHLQDALAAADSPLAPLLREPPARSPSSSPTAGGGGSPTAGAAEGLAGALAVLVERVCGGQGADALHGLDSMQAIQLAEAVRREFGRPVGVADVLRCSDLGELLEAVQSAASKQLEPGSSGVAAGEAIGNGEERPWRIWLCGLGSKTCTVDWMVSRQDRSRHLDVLALQRAVDRLVARHAALRARNHSEQPMFESTYAAASLWQLWCAGSGSGGRSGWTRTALGRIASSSIFGAWPRSSVLRASEAEAKTTVLVPTVGDLKECECSASEDQQAFWVGGMLLGKKPGDMFHVCAVPIFEDTGDVAEADAGSVALTRPAESVRWYVYACLDHGFCDGPTGAPLFADLLHLYAEEAGEVAPEDATAMEEARNRKPAEALARLEKRLLRSLMPLPEGEHSNEDIFHDGLCGFGWRKGFQRFIRFDTHLMRLLRVGATQSLGCSVDIAWLTAIAAAFLRMFPSRRRLDLYLIVTCRDGPGEEALIGYFSSRKLMPLEVGDARGLTLLGLADMISTARRQRTWRRPRPYEKAEAIEVNMVSQAADGLPMGFQEVRCRKSAPKVWDRSGTSHMTLRLDQVARDDWDFRLHSHDAAWGTHWSSYYAQALGSVLVDMAARPTGPVVPEA